MKETLKSKKGITLIALVITIIILILLAGVTIGILGGENGIINKAKESKRIQKIAEIKEKIGLELMSAETDATLRGETLELAQRDDIASKYGTVDGDILTTTEDNYEIDLKEIYNNTLSTSGSYTSLKQAYETASSDLALATASQSELATELQKTTATTDDILSGKKAYVGSSVQEGTMTDNGAVDEEIAVGESYTIPQGYHNGSGKVTAKSQSIDSNEAADEGKILKDYKAYVNGELKTGQMVNNGAVSGSVGVGGTYTIPEGYHNGSGTVTGPTASNQTITLTNSQTGNSTHTYNAAVGTVTVNATNVYNKGKTDGAAAATISFKRQTGVSSAFTVTVATNPGDLVVALTSKYKSSNENEGAWDTSNRMTCTNATLLTADGTQGNYNCGAHCGVWRATSTSCTITSSNYNICVGVYGK